MFRLILRQYSGMSTQEHIPEDTVTAKGPSLYSRLSFSEDSLSTAKTYILHLRAIERNT